MANPTFNGASLFDEAARDLPEAPEARVYLETLPGVDGQYAQLHGRGGRDIVATGRVTATGESPTAAHANVKSALRSRQALADGRTCAVYVGTDGSAYDRCILLSFAANAAVEMARLSDSSFLASLPCRARFRQLVS